jgi:outer membrane beta-barrel protein
LLFIACCLAPTLALAEEENPDDQPFQQQAIQERTYRMGAEIAAGGGTLPVDPYTKQIYGQGALVFHFTDWLAWQIARGAYGYNFSSGLRQQLERDFAVLPTSFDQVQFFVGSDVMLTPFYGKSALANRFVIHYEAYVLLGATVFKYAGGAATTDASGKTVPAPLVIRPGIDVGAGLRIFQNKVISYRLEFIDSIVVTGSVGNVFAASLMLCFNIGFTE